MSATQTSSPAAPELTSLSRVYSIPLVADSLNTIHAHLSSSTYLSSPYHAGLSLTGRAYSLSQPIQARLAPVLLRADGFANKGIDAVESRYPYPFQTPTQDIYRDLRSTTDHAVGVANKTASDVAHDLDSRLTPLVNRYESIIHRFVASSSNENTSETSSDHSDSTAAVNAAAKSQVERVYKLTLDLRNQIYTLSSEQLKQLQAQSTVVQKVTEAVYDLNTQIVNSYANAKGRGASIRNQTQSKVHELGHAAVQQLEKIQASSAALPAHLQASIKPISDSISSTVASISSILKSDAPVAEKAGKIREALQKEVQPLVETTLDSLHTYVEASRKYVINTSEKVEEKTKEATPKANGKPN